MSKALRLEGLDVTGQCYCGDVTFKVSIPSGEKPLFTTYCHCESCRRAHAAPVYQVVMGLEEWFTFTTGEALVTKFKKHADKGPIRSFCSQCGSKLTVQIPGYFSEGKPTLGFFPALLEEAVQRDMPEMLKPTGVNEAGSCVVDFKVLQG
jgi:ADP-ribosyl-[dinitrogen reductase] hydrolase